VNLSVVLPCFDEEANVEATIRDTLDWFDRDGIDGRVIAVNDGSRDRTGEILAALAGEHERLSLVTHETNRGYGAAVRSGCDAAESTWVGFMDSDGQFRAEDFAALIRETQAHAFVAGRRVRRADPWPRVLYARLYSVVVWLTLGVRVQDLNCAMKIFERAIWPRIRPTHGTGALFNAEVFYRLRRAGIDWVQVPVAHYPRAHGRQTGASPVVILRALRELIALRRDA